MPKRRRRIAYWRRLVAQQAASTLSASAFCREEQISLNQFYRWRSRLRREKGQQESSVGFLELVVSPRQSESGVRLRFGDSLWIEVERGFDPVTLRAVIEAISGEGEQSCLP